MKSVAEVQAIINANKPLDFSNLLSRSIDLYMKIWVQGVLACVIGYCINNTSFYSILPSIFHGYWF